MVERIDLFKSKSYIVYEPALPLLQVDIHSSGPIQSQAGYRMYSTESGKLKRSGRATHLVKPISQSQFETPAGLIDGYYLEIEIEWTWSITANCLSRSASDAVWMRGRFTDPRGIR